MTEENEKKKKFPVPAPVIALVAIFLIWFVAQVFMGPEPVRAPRVSEEGTTESAPAAETPANTSVITSSRPPELVDVDSSELWSTYHGGPNLNGVSDATIPDKPRRLWRYQTDRPVYLTPVATADRIFFATSRGGIFALDYAGKEKWSKKLVRRLRDDGKPIYERFDAPLSAFGSIVLAGSMHGTLYALDAGTGDERWTYELDGPILGTVNIHQAEDGKNRLFLLSQDDGSLHSIDMETGQKLWQSEPIDRCDGSAAVGGKHIVFGSCAAALHVFSAVDGSLVRNIEFDEDSQVAGGVAMVGSSVFAGSHSGRFFHADAESGEIYWISQQGEDEVFTTPSIHGNQVLYGSYDGNLYCVDRTTGEKVWEFVTNGLPTSPVIASGKAIFSSDGILYFLDIETGEEVWSYEVSDEITSPAIIGEMVVVGGDDGTVTAFGADA